MKLAKLKVKQQKHCQEGKHKFIVSAWRNGPHGQRSIEFSCTECLLSVDKDEKDALNVQYCSVLNKNVTQSDGA